MGPQIDHVTAALADLPDVDLAVVVERALIPRIGVQRAAAVATVLSSALAEDEQVAQVAGPPVDVIDHLTSEARRRGIRAVAYRVVLGTPMYRSAAVAEALGRTGSNARQAASTLRRQGGLLGLEHGNRYLYPAFQFDLQRHRIHPIVAEINRVLDAVGDPWGVTSWWISDNARLGGQAPADLIGDRDGDLRDLAAGELDD